MRVVPQILLTPPPPFALQRTKAMSDTYIFCGPEVGEKNDTVAGLLKASQKKYGTVETYKFYATETRAAEVVTLLQNTALFSPALFVTFYSAEAIKQKNDVESLALWIAHSKTSPNTLVLLSEERSIDKKIEAAVPSKNKKIFWEMFENRKQQWLENFFQKNGYSVTNEAIECILEMVENNTQSLRDECSRFFWCFKRGTMISATHVEQILSHNRAESPFTLFEAMADNSKPPRHRLSTALEILDKIRSSKDTPAIALIAGLTYSFRQLKNWHALCAGGKYPSEAEFKAAGFAYKKAREKCQSAARIWKAGEVSSILALLAQTDLSLRETGAVFEETYLSLLVYAIVIKNGSHLATYES